MLHEYSSFLVELSQATKDIPDSTLHV